MMREALPETLRVGGPAPWPPGSNRIRARLIPARWPEPPGNKRDRETAHHQEEPHDGRRGRSQRKRGLRAEVREEDRHGVGNLGGTAAADPCHGAQVPTVPLSSSSVIHPSIGNTIFFIRKVFKYTVCLHEARWPQLRPGLLNRDLPGSCTRTQGSGCGRRRAAPLPIGQNRRDLGAGRMELGMIRRPGLPGKIDRNGHNRGNRGEGWAERAEGAEHGGGR